MLAKGLTQAACAADVAVPEGSFLTYMAGQYNDEAWGKFEGTKGRCVQFVKLAAGNHYAITDWNPDTAPRQVRLSCWRTQLLLSCCHGSLWWCMHLDLAADVLCNKLIIMPLPGICTQTSVQTPCASLTFVKALQALL